MRAVIEALQALRGIALVSAVTIVGGSRRALALCQTATADGLQRRGRERGFQRRSGPGAAAITKTGNAHLRRVVVEAAWAYRHRPAVGADAAQAPGAPSVPR